MDKTLIINFGGTERLTLQLVNCLNWIEKSFKINNNQGSSAYRSIFSNWAPAYPETTGYLIPSLINASEILQEDKWFALAKKQIQYFKSIQLSNGAFPVNKNQPTPLAFDTSQILLGLLLYYKKTGDSDCIAMIQSCYSWIISTISDKGIIERYNLHNKFNPSYYTRIAWSILFYEKEFGLDHTNKSLNFYNHLKSFFNEGDFISSAGFYPDQSAYSHTVSYALRGLFESANILEDDSSFQIIKEELLKLKNQIEERQGFPGKFDKTRTGDFSFICSTGHLQLATLYLLIARLQSSQDYNSVIEILLGSILNKQRKYLFNKGAIPSSIPIYGEYQRLKYTNWTQNFS